jgi:hypothetical protein
MRRGACTLVDTGHGSECVLLQGGVQSSEGFNGVSTGKKKHKLTLPWIQQNHTEKHVPLTVD